MNKKFLKLGAGVLASSLLVGSLFIFPKNEEVITNAGDLSYTIDNFVTCENWHNSGKGFELEFTFDPVSVECKNSFSVLDGTNKDKRLSNYASLQFHTDGSVTSDVGNVVKNENSYSLYVMFEDMSINTAEGATADMTVTKINFKWADIKIERIEARLIDSKLLVLEQGKIRDSQLDDNHALSFSGFIPNYEKNKKYGMAIVPSEYIGNLNANYCEVWKQSMMSYSETYVNPTVITNGELLQKYGSGYIAKASLNVKENNYLRNFVPVFFVEDESGNRRYANNINFVQTSLYKVSSKAIIDNDSSLSESAKEYAKNILKTVETKSPKMTIANVTANVIPNSVQVKKYDIFSATDTVLRFKAAKAETETAQLVMTSSSTIDTTFFAGTTDFVNDSFRISSDNVEVDFEKYINITSNWSATDEHTKYLPKMYPDGYTQLDLGEWPDQLIPMDVAVRTAQNRFFEDTESNSNQGLFFRLSVPKDAPAGVYSGRLAINIKGKGMLYIPTELTVLDFSLENRKQANTFINIDRPQLGALYGDKAQYQDLSNPYFNSANKFLNDRGIGSGIINKRLSRRGDIEAYIKSLKEFISNSKTDTYALVPNFEPIEMKWTYKTSKWGTKIVDMTGDNAEEVFVSDTFEYEENGDRYYKLGLKEILTDLVNASTDDLDLLKNAVLFDAHADEPGKDTLYLRNILNYNSLRCSINYVLQNCDFTGKPGVRNSLNNLFYMCTAGPEVQFVGKGTTNAINDVKSISNVVGGTHSSCSTMSDIKYTELTNYTPNMMWTWDHKETHGGGQCYDALAKIYSGEDTSKTIWEYTCVQPVSPYPSFTLNTPMIKTRANRWRQFDLRFQGQYFYMANRTQDYYNNVSYPLTEEEILNRGVYYEGASSDGLLMYPCHDTYGYAQKGLYWFSSLRLENTAEGNDDTNYMILAKELISKLPTQNQQMYMSRLSEICKMLSTNNNPYYVTGDPSVLTNARDNLINLILEIK